jgi:hypothetical protein
MSPLYYTNSGQKYSDCKTMLILYILTAFYFACVNLKIIKIGHELTSEYFCFIDEIEIFRVIETENDTYTYGYLWRFRRLAGCQCILLFFFINYAFALIFGTIYQRV